ncbi:MAG: hypothetical protein RB294_11310, partial [Bacteroidales bacterium]|nr:hypothetical protein [Bacteroidales bacterium]
YFSCQTTQLAYILRKFEDSFNYLSPKNIELSGLFITRTETILKESNIKKSLTVCNYNPSEQITIDKAIKKFIEKK